MLKVSDGLKLPIDFVTQTAAILARKRVGKTYTASVLAEEMVKAKLPFVALDPTGAWWGLRSSADGKSEGLPVVIIGGAHGDVPLEPTAGKVIADLVIDHPGYYVIDLSQTESDAAQDRFATDFAVRLYRYKEQHRFPMQLFIDEADAFAPQNPQKGQERMLGAFDTLVRRGGIRGLGVTMITQRPAVLNKNMLTQIEMLIVLQITSPQDQDAIDNWVKRNGTKEQRDEMMSSLASMQKGEAWFWSPSWLEIFKRVQVRERHTFNSSATPKVGEKAYTPVAAAAVDLEQLGAEIAATIERAKADDPKELKAQLAALRKQLAERPTITPSVKEPEIKYVDRPVLNGEVKDFLGGVAELKELFAPLLRLPDTLLPLTKSLAAIEGKVEAVRALQTAPMRKEFVRVVNHQPAPYETRPAAPRVPAPRSLGTATKSDGDLAVGERKILTAAAQYPNGVTREQLTILTGYKRSSRDTYLQRLAQRGYVSVQGSAIVATADGYGALGNDFEPLPTGSALQAFWMNRLSGGEKEILRVAINYYPQPIERTVLDEATGYKRSSRDTYIQRLQARRLVNAERGTIRASDELFD